MIRVMLTCVIFLLSTVAGLANCDNGETVITMGVGDSISGSARLDSAKKLEELVNREMQGKACLRLVIDSKGLADDTVLSAVAEGKVQLAAPAFGGLAKDIPQYAIFSMPFLFDDYQAVSRFQSNTSVIEILGKSLEGKAVILGYWHRGFQQLSAKRPLFAPEDLQGLKLYSANDDANSLARALKSVPVEVSPAQVLTSLKEGRIEALSARWDELAENKKFQFQDGVSQSNHIYEGYQFLASQSWWNGLEAGFRRELAGILLRVSQETNQRTVFEEERSKRAVLRGNKPVFLLTEGQREAWRAAASAEISRLAESAGAALVNHARSANNVP